MKTKYDWSKIELRVNFVARDANKQYFGYTHIPKINPWGFAMTEGFAARLYGINDDIDWKDSLEERPK